MYFNPSGKREKGSQPIISYSNQPLTFSRKMSFGLGRLVPFMCQYVMPSEKLKGNIEYMLRTNPFASQVYQRFNVDIHYYYVPISMIWQNFALFLSGGFSGTEDKVHPYIDYLFWVDRVIHKGSLFDYMDLSLPDAHLTNDQDNDPLLQHFYINSLPFSAYFKVFADHFASPHYEYGEFIQEMIEQQNLATFAYDGDNSRTLFSLFNMVHMANYSFDQFTNLQSPTSNLCQLPYAKYDWDYFTSAMPEQQHGPLMQIPLQLVDTSEGARIFRYAQPEASASSSSERPVYVKTTDRSSEMLLFTTDSQGVPSSQYPVTINGDVIENRALISDLRSVELLTEFFESLGNVSFKPEDYYLSQFNVKNLDARMMRSYHIGSQRFYVNIGEVFSNNATATVGEPQSSVIGVPGVGTSTAKGYGVGDAFNFQALDYGYVLGFAVVHPEAAYSQGVPRHFRKLDRFDYENPKFAHLGYQEVFNYELAFNRRSSSLDPFGYQPRYSDHRTNINRVNGDFRSKTNINTSSRMFTDRMPVLGEPFLQANPSYNNSNRVFNSIDNFQTILPIQMDMVMHLDSYMPLPPVGLPRV